MKRLPTGVPGLDPILQGGLFEGGVYIFEGPPGAGKTTLANQIAYGRARAGDKTLYVTLLAESHNRLISHMEGQAFFDRQHVNTQVVYQSAYREFDQSGLAGVLKLVHGELARQGATLLVVDGLADARAGVDEDVRRFIHELQSLLGTLRCTGLLLLSGRGKASSAEQTMVDGIFAFQEETYHWRAERRMQVRKFRGSEVARGQHTFCITAAGVEFFARLESLPFERGDAALGQQHHATGLTNLDGVLRGGGLLAGSCSVLVGNTGTGKTSAAIAFAGGASRTEPGLMLSCTETLPDLLARAGGFANGFGKALESGVLVVELLGRQDESLDEMGHKLLRAIDARQVRRLVVDGLAGLADTLAFPERGYRFMGRLLMELKARGVTSLFTVDPGTLAAASGSTLVEGVTGWFDNVLELADGTPEQPARSIVIRKERTGSLARGPVRVML